MSVEGVSPSALPRCAVHPDEPAGGTCSRCGAFVCTPCATWVTERLFCAACAARPEVNYLETFRLSLWGRRDGSTYLVAVFTGVLALCGVMALLHREWLLGLVLLALLPVGVGFFLGRAWARIGLVVAPLAAGAVLFHQLGGSAVSVSVFSAVVALNLISETRNALFFRRPVPLRSLYRLWDRRVNNPLARHALNFGFSGVFVPLFAPFAIGCGMVALSRVDSKARPPIGGGGRAVASIVLGVLSLVVWGGFLLPRFFESLHAIFGP